MKIVISGYVGKKITGIGRNLICLLNHAPGNIQYVVYTNEDMAEEFVFDNPNVSVKTYPVSKNSSMGNLLWTTFAFPFAVLKEKADRALIPNFTLLLFKFRPTIVILHDLIEFNVPDKFSKKKMFYRTKIADPITAKLADHIITVSNNSKKDIRNFLGISEEKITVIYNGVDQNKFSKMDHEKATDILKRKGWPTDFLLYAGTIDYPGKNAMAVIKAFEELKRDGKYSGKLILAGMQGAGFETVASYISASAYEKDIVLTGYVTDEELVALYSECAVFCFVSLYEGFGIPPLEALSCGARVVVSDTSSLPEVVGDVGIKVDPQNITAIISGIEQALNQGDSEAFSDAVKKHLMNYQWQNLGTQFADVMQRKLNK